MEWEMMRGTADGQEHGAKGGRTPTGGLTSSGAAGPTRHDVPSAVALMSVPLVIDAGLLPLEILGYLVGMWTFTGGLRVG